MAVDDPNNLDALGLDPDTGHALLVITDHLDWTDIVAHMNALQAKIAAYIGFIQSGEIDVHLPEGKDRPRRIGIIQQFEPPETAIELLEGLAMQLAAFNIDFVYGPLPEGYEGMD